MKLKDDLTEQELYLIYEVSDQVFHKRLKRVDGIEKLKRVIKLHKPDSLAMYIDGYRYLKTGEPYGRNMGKDIIDVFLTNIYKDSGIYGLTKALMSIKRHLVYYFKRTGIRQHADLEIGKRFSEKYNVAIDFSDRIFSDNDESEKDEYIRLVDEELFFDNDIIIEPVKKPKKINKKTSSYKRDIKVSAAALKNSNYRCELCEDHETFIRKSNNKPYTEPHHLIPLSKQPEFENSLDVVNNIVSLCSNCHNKLHYGKNIQQDIIQLYEKRKQQLKMAGIEITIDELIKYYD